MDIFTNQQPMEKRKGRFRLCAPPSYLLHLLLSDPKLDPGGPEPQGAVGSKGQPSYGDLPRSCQGRGIRKGQPGLGCWVQVCLGGGGGGEGAAEPTPSEPWEVGEGATGPRISGNLEVVWAGASIHQTTALGPGKGGRAQGHEMRGRGGVPSVTAQAAFPMGACQEPRGERREGQAAISGAAGARLEAGRGTAGPGSTGCPPALSQETALGSLLLAAVMVFYGYVENSVLGE